MNDPWYRSTCQENGWSLRDMYRFEANGNPGYRETFKKPMSKKEREEKGLQRWLPDIDYEADQGGNDTNYRRRQPKAKAQKTANSDQGDSGWKKGSWPSVESDRQWGTAAASKDDRWEQADWWYT